MSGCSVVVVGGGGGKERICVIEMAVHGYVRINDYRGRVVVVVVVVVGIIKINSSSSSNNSSSFSFLSNYNTLRTLNDLTLPTDKRMILP